MRPFLPAALAVFLCVPAGASMVQFSSGPLSTNGIGSFVGSMTWSYLGSGSGLLEISLTNTTDASVGGYITGFMFNVAPSSLAVQLTSAPNGLWQGLQGASANPFGVFDFGASLGGGFEGGPQPSHGIATGATGVLKFAVSGSAPALQGLSAMSFFDAVGGHAAIARFRGFGNGSSDKVVAAQLTVPGAGPICLLALGGLFARRRR
jgi:hypothetical protein